jgi:hypothetical protein
MALGYNQPLTEMSTRKSLWGKARQACKADNLTPTCELIIWIMWDPRHLTTLQASMACYKDRFTFLFFLQEHQCNCDTSMMAVVCEILLK